MSAFSSRVLLAVDDSPGSSRAARMAVGLSRSLRAELYIVHVGLEEYIDPRLWGSEPEFRNTVRERAEEVAKPKLNEQVQKIREAGGEVSGAYVRIGRPDAEIVALAEELGAGLVIVGSRGKGLLKRALMGSVSNSVVRHAPAPVLVVRGDRQEEGGRHLPGTILLALDGSDEARTAARAAVEISNATNSKLRVLYVIEDTPLNPYVPYPGPEAWEVSDDVLREHKENARAFLKGEVERIEAGGGAVEEAHLAVGVPAKEIVRAGEELGAGLIVVGSRGLGAVGRALMGSVSTSVVCHAHCPVLVVREEDTVARESEALERSLGR